MITSTLVTLTLALVTGQDKKREPHPYAPSIPQITKEEQAQIEKVIKQFVLADTGKLPKAEAKKALTDFQRLGPESIFSLIEAFNDAAELQDSCPAVIIARQIAKVLNSSEDLKLLAFAKDNLGAGVVAKRHLGCLKDLQFAIQLRKGAVQRKILATGGDKKLPRNMSVAELASAAGKERGQPLKNILTEIEKREGAAVVKTLGTAAAGKDADIRDFAQPLLAKHLSRQKPELLKAIVKDERAEVRAAAAHAIAAKKLKWGAELIKLVEDADPKVNQAARMALKSISGGADYGPSPDATSEDRNAAARRWREWWASEPRR
jgi:HEAT repeats